MAQDTVDLDGPFLPAPRRMQDGWGGSVARSARLEARVFSADRGHPDLIHQSVKRAFAEREIVAQALISPVQFTEVVPQLAAGVIGQIFIPEPVFFAVLLGSKAVEFSFDPVDLVGCTVAAFEQGVNVGRTDALVASPL
jgi:hypothetical protein